MNETNRLSALLGLIEAIAMLDGLESPREPNVVDGFVLVPLTDGNQIYDEGVRQNNALIMPQMRSMLRQQGIEVMSMRVAETDVSVLSLSVSEDGIVRHVVGKHNTAPSAEQLDVLHRLLVAEGIELQYNPFSMY